MSFFDQTNEKRVVSDERVNVWNRQKIHTHQDPGYKQQARKAQDAAASKSPAVGGKAVKTVPGFHPIENIGRLSKDTSGKAGSNTGGQAPGSSKRAVGPTNFAKNAPSGLGDLPSSSSRAGEKNQSPHLRRPDGENMTAINSSTKRGVRVPPASMNAGTAAKSAKLTSKFPCSYMECTRGFAKEKELKNHKEEDHDYCRLCDENFTNFDELLAHKVSERAHICCKICGQDFHSDGGRNIHMRQAHTTLQECKCVGCGLNFDKGSALVYHIYNNLCPGGRIPTAINQETMRKNRAQAALHLDLLSQGGPGNANRLIAGSQLGVDDDDTSVGGVPLEPHILDIQDQTGSPSGALDKVQGVDEANTDLMNFSSSGSSTPKEVDSEFPTLGEAASMKGKKKDTAIEGLSSLKLKNSDPSSPWAMTFFPKGGSGEGTGVTMVDYRRTILADDGGQKHLIATDWDHHMFKRHDLDGHFYCPFTNCEVNSLDIDNLKVHLTSGYHQGTDHRCIKCLKTFGTPAALVAHMESNSERCKMKTSEHFGQILSVISGGFLGAKGQDVDGNVQICALNQMELEEQAREQRALMAYEDPNYDWYL